MGPWAGSGVSGCWGPGHVVPGTHGRGHVGWAFTSKVGPPPPSGPYPNESSCLLLARCGQPAVGLGWGSCCPAPPGVALGESLVLTGPWFPPLWGGLAVRAHVPGARGALEWQLPSPAHSCFCLQVSKGVQAARGPGSAGLGGGGALAPPGWPPWGQGDDPRRGPPGLGGQGALGTRGCGRAWRTPSAATPLAGPPGAGEEARPPRALSLSRTLSPPELRPAGPQGSLNPVHGPARWPISGLVPAIPGACGLAWGVGSRLGVAFAPSRWPHPCLCVP